MEGVGKAENEDNQEKYKVMEETWELGQKLVLPDKLAVRRYFLKKKYWLQSMRMITGIESKHDCDNT